MTDIRDPQMPPAMLEAAVRAAWAGQGQPAPEGAELLRSMKILDDTLKAGAAIRRTADKTRPPMVGARRDIE